MTLVFVDDQIDCGKSFTKICIQLGIADYDCIISEQLLTANQLFQQVKLKRPKKVLIHGYIYDPICVPVDPPEEFQGSPVAVQLRDLLKRENIEYEILLEKNCTPAIQQSLENHVLTIVQSN